MRLVEAVLGELLHEVEELFGELPGDAAFRRPFQEDGALLGHLLRFLLAHGPAQEVRAAQAVAREHLGHQHHLLLIHDDAVGGLEYGLQVGMEILRPGAAVLAVDEIVHHAGTQRAGAVQGHQRDDVLEAVALEAPLQILRRARFRLEHGGGVAVGEELVHRRVVQGQVLQPEVRPLRVERAHERHRLGQDGEGAQAEEVELHQADLLDVVLVELAHRGLGAGGGIERAEVGELARRDEHAPRVHAHVAGEALQLLGQGQQLADFLFLLGPGVDLRLFLPRLGKRDAQLVGDELGELVHEVEAQIEHPAHVADHRLGGHGAEGGDLRDGVAAVVALHVIDDPVAPVLAEVHVEVGHGHPLGVEEALEQQVIAQRVQVGDAQAVGHQGAGARAAPGAHRHAVVLGPVDEVGDDEEVARKAHLQDGLDLELQARRVLRALLPALRRIGKELDEALLQALRRLVRQERVEGDAFRGGEQGQLVLAQLDGEAAAPGDLHRVFQRLRQVGEEGLHLRLGFEILLLGEGLGAAGIGQDIALGDAHPRLVGLEVLAVQELHRVGGHHRQVELRRQPHAGGDEGLRLGLAVALQFQVEAAGEERRPLPRRLFGRGPVARQQGLAHVAAGRAGQGDEAAVVAFGQGRAGYFRPAAVAGAEIGPGEELAQAQVARRVLRQEEQPGTAILPGGGRSRARRRDPGVAADDGLEALAAGRAVELDHAEQVGQIGQGQRRHAVGHRPGHGLVQADHAVGDGVFAVQAQMDESGGSHAGILLPGPTP